MTSLPIILIQTIRHLLHPYKKMETQTQPFRVIKFPQLNGNHNIHNDRYYYILSTIRCLIYIYISFQICLIFLSK